jgi:hypothetical protein
MSKPKLNGLAGERAELEMIRDEHNRRADAVRQARVALIQHHDLVEQARTPQGVLEMSDQQIATAEKEQRDALRALARAENELAAFERGLARNLDQRIRDLQRREWEAAHAATLAAARAADEEYLAIGRQMASLEARRAQLYKELGWGEPIALVRNTGSIRNDWDRARYSIGCLWADLLEPTDPQRLMREREQANDAYFRNPPRRPVEQLPPVLPRPLLTPATRVTNALRALNEAAP